MYLSEMAPYKYRGAFNTGFQICVGTGTLLSSLVNYATEKISGGWGWRLSLALAAVPTSILTTGAVFLPDTPSSLIQHGKDSQKVKILLQRIRGTSDVGRELADLIIASEKTIKRPFKKILLRKYRPQLVMALAIPFFQQVTGINMVVFYAPILFRTIGAGESASLLCAVVIGLVGMSTTILSLFIVDKVGRRILFQIGGIQMLVTQVLIGIIMAVKLGDQGGLSKGFSTSVLILICLYVAGFGLSWGPLGWLVPSEIFPLEIRSAAQSINVAVGFLTTFIVAQTFLAILCKFKSALFFFFGGWVALMTVFVFFLLPETKDVPLEKMGRIWRGHWFWKRYVVDVEDNECADQE